METRFCRTRPTLKYATQFFDYSLDAIGVRQRTIELLERELGVAIVRDLVPISRDTLNKVPQLGEVALDELLQCMANIGIPVFQYRPNLSKVPVPPHVEDESYGLPDSERFCIYSPPHRQRR